MQSRNLIKYASQLIALLLVFILIYNPLDIRFNKMTDFNSTENYQEVMIKLDSFFANDKNHPLYKKISKNIKTLQSYLPKNNQAKLGKKQEVAQEAFVQLKIILTALDKCLKEYQVKNKDWTEKELFIEIMQGGHILIDDGGNFYDYLKSLATLPERYSSHYHTDKIARLVSEGKTNEEATQLVKQGKQDRSLVAETVVNEMLFGEVYKDGKRYTWFQMEGHSHHPRKMYGNWLANVVDWIIQKLSFKTYSLEKFGHHCDWARYAFWHKRQKNIGQYGVSEYTESKPIQMQPR